VDNLHFKLEGDQVTFEQHILLDTSYKHVYTRTKTQRRTSATSGRSKSIPALRLVRITAYRGATSESPPKATSGPPDKQGAARWTVYGAVAVAIGHFTWPLFRRQTLALKGFLTSSCTSTHARASYSTNSQRLYSDW
jgi:hypothetical protein